MVMAPVTLTSKSTVFSNVVTLKVLKLHFSNKMSFTKRERNKHQISKTKQILIRKTEINQFESRDNNNICKKKLNKPI